MTRPAATSSAGGRMVRRSVLVAPETSSLQEVAVRDPGRGEILVQVLLNGLCASDLPTWLAGPRDDAPIALGHEPVGRVVAVGSDVSAVVVGDIVTGRLSRSFAELMIAAAHDIVVVPPGLSLEAGLGEPLGCIVEALRRARLDTGDRVAVVGLGFMGLCLLQLLAASGIGEAVAVDHREDACRAAVAHGASIAHHPEQILTLPGMRDGFDVVFEVAGVQAALDLATALVKPHGTLDVVGYHQGRRTVDLQVWNWKALDVVNGHVRDQNRLAEAIRRGLDVVAAGRIDYASLITHRYPLSAIDQAFADMRAKPDGFIKAVIMPGQ
jgi:L-iditol 2-dehydrogenase